MNDSSTIAPETTVVNQEVQTQSAPIDSEVQTQSAQTQQTETKVQEEQPKVDIPEDIIKYVKNQGGIDNLQKLINEHREIRNTPKAAEQPVAPAIPQVPVQPAQQVNASSTPVSIHPDVFTDFVEKLQYEFGDVKDKVSETLTELGSRVFTEQNGTVVINRDLVRNKMNEVARVATLEKELATLKAAQTAVPTANVSTSLDNITAETMDKLTAERIIRQHLENPYGAKHPLHDLAVTKIKE